MRQRNYGRRIRRLLGHDKAPSGRRSGVLVVVVVVEVLRHGDVPGRLQGDDALAVPGVRRVADAPALRRRRRIEELFNWSTG